MTGTETGPGIFNTRRTSLIGRDKRLDACKNQLKIVCVTIDPSSLMAYSCFYV